MRLKYDNIEEMQTDAGSCWRLGQQLACTDMNVSLDRIGFDFLIFYILFSNGRC